MKRVTQERIFIISFFILLFLLLLIFFLPRQAQGLKGYQTTQVKIENKTYRLFVADTEEKRKRGLSNISSIKDGEGMIFVFNKPDYYRFWMKDMKFPLDFLFLRGDQVVDLLANVDPSTYPQTFISKSPADKIIELKAGEIDKLGVNISDTISVQEQ